MKIRFSYQKPEQEKELKHMKKMVKHILWNVLGQTI